MFANELRPIGRDNRSTPSLREKQAGHAKAPPKSPCGATFPLRHESAGSGKESRNPVRRDDFQGNSSCTNRKKSRPSLPGPRATIKTQRSTTLPAFPAFGAAMVAAFQHTKMQKLIGSTPTHRQAVQIATGQCASLRER